MEPSVPNAPFIVLGNPNLNQSESSLVSRSVYLSPIDRDIENLKATIRDYTKAGNVTKIEALNLQLKKLIAKKKGVRKND